QNLQITNSDGALFKLDEFSRIIYSYGLSNISRLNQRKQIEVTFRFESEINDSKSMLEAARDEVTELIASINKPEDIALEVVHDESELNEFYFLMGIAFVLIFMILASVFESLLTPVVMMFTIPLAAVGSFWALILTGNSLFNANSLTGFLILLGVVVNNGIILIDYTNILRRRGWRRTRALMTAGMARVRPILITAITTIVAMFPLAMGKTEYVSKIGASFAITVIGGLAFSTIFTLVFIPTVYSALETALEWLRQLSRKLKVIQIFVFAAVCLLIYTGIDSLLWQFGWLFISLIAIPGFTWFITTSLKQARTDFLDSKEPLTINIRNIVKIYDDYSRFIKEWKKGEQIQKRIGTAKTFSSIKDFNQFTWQLPLLTFMIYFVYFYIDSHTWLFLLSVMIYLYVLFIFKPVVGFLKQYAVKEGKAFYSLIAGMAAGTLLWGFPLFSIRVFHGSGFRTEMSVFIFLCWYLILIVYTTSNKLHREKINIMRLTGRFADVRKQFYRSIGRIPVIGKKKNPFLALEGASFNIETGMFGLLGPNGAGKTTIM
ncbi:efflux RND transporter permease subunit, partial [bacterium]|nr:efflux RND transporter permease subunit [bacterium]